MSRTYTDNAPDPQAEVNAHRVERDSSQTSRWGLTRESARTEMERFRGVAEYEIRKLLGQRKALRVPEPTTAQDAAPDDGRDANLEK
jgi:hypothetical protein